MVSLGSRLLCFFVVQQTKIESLIDYENNSNEIYGVIHISSTTMSNRNDAYRSM